MVEKRENAPAFSLFPIMFSTLFQKQISILFPTMFSTLPKTNLNFLVTSIVSSAYAFNLDRSKILSLGKKLKVNGSLIQMNTIVKKLFYMLHYERISNMLHSKRNTNVDSKNNTRQKQLL